MRKSQSPKRTGRYKESLERGAFSKSQTEVEMNVIQCGCCRKAQGRRTEPQSLGTMKTIFSSEGQAGRNNWV